MTSAPMATKSAAPSALKGVLLVAAAVFLFASGDAVTKHLSVAYGVTLIVFGRYLVNLVLLVVLYTPRNGAEIWRTNRTALVILRGLCLSAATLTASHALRLMPLGETVTIIYLAPFAVLLLAGPILGERVSTAGWIGAIVAFAGVLLIMRPGGALDPLGVTLALTNAALGTAYHLLTRILSRTETTMAMLFHTAWVGMAVFGMMLIGLGTGPLPDIGATALIVALGCFATLGHFLFTAAYREAPASLLAPVNYLHLVWAAILGWLVFDHLPDAISILGMALVVSAGIAVAIRASAKF